MSFLNKTMNTVMSTARIILRKNLAISNHLPKTILVMPHRSRSMFSTSAITDKDQMREFMAVFPDIIRELTENEVVSSSKGGSKWISELLQYNVPNGNKHRGLILVKSYRMLESADKLNPEAIRRAIIMGWCVEMFQAYHIIIDDLIHGSLNRRGQPCWYIKAGNNTINDTSLIHAAMYLTLQKHFGNKPYYVDVLHIFNDIIAKVANGQLMEKFLWKDGRPDLSQFTMKQYDNIVKFKTCYFRFQMPVVLAMKMCLMNDPEKQRQANTILLEIGQFFQVQRDYLDCFGDPQATGFMGTDIMNGRCSWLTVVALQRANPAQKKFLEEHYGTKNPDDTLKIKNLYEELGLKTTYKVYEEKTNQAILTHIQQLTRNLPHELFRSIMKSLYGRTF